MHTIASDRHARIYRVYRVPGTIYHTRNLRNITVLVNIHRATYEYYIHNNLHCVQVTISGCTVATFRRILSFQQSRRSASSQTEWAISQRNFIYWQLYLPSETYCDGRWFVYSQYHPHPFFSEVFFITPPRLLVRSTPTCQFPLV